MGIIEEIAKCMPANYVVDLVDPDVFVLVEVFKVCRVSFCSATADSDVSRMCAE